LKPLPKPNADTKPFWEGCKDHQLRFQKCRECGFVRWPPSLLCPSCHSAESDWIRATGKGRVYSFAVYHVAFHPAFKDDIPYVTAVVELDEGPRLLTDIIGCNPSDVTCDMPLDVIWHDISEELSLPKFKPISHPE
jgi:uncharacterized OB-fold protein